MAVTKSLVDCRGFCADVEQHGGTIPRPLARLLAVADLLTAPGGQEPGLRPIVTAALRGELTDARKLDKLIADVAQQLNVADLRAQLRQLAEPLVVEAFHAELRSGSADLVLNSLRGKFTEAAAEIAEARSLIPTETELTQWLGDAKPEAITAWQALPGLLTTVNGIGQIAANFGARPAARFPLLKEPGYADCRVISDTALFGVASSSLIADSVPFLRGGPDQHRASPWFVATPLRLNTVAQATQRFEEFCAGEWDKTHANTTVQFTKPDGTAGELELTNPHRESAKV